MCLRDWGRIRPLPPGFDKTGDVAALLENTLLEEPFFLELVTLSPFLALWAPLSDPRPPRTHVNGRSWSSYPPRFLDPNTQFCFSSIELSHPPYPSLGKSRAGTGRWP